MKIDEPSVRHEFENLLPLINVVFLLLIFFMLAGSLSQADRFEITAPSADNEPAADLGAMTILLNARGQVAVDDTVYSDEQLKLLIEERLVAGVVTDPQLKADARLASGRLLDLIELFGSAGLDSIRLLTLPPEQAIAAGD